MGKILFCLASCLAASFCVSSTEMDTSDSSDSSDSAFSTLSKQNIGCKVPYPKPADCEEVRRNGHNTSGMYTVYPRNRLGLCSLTVFCDMHTMGGGWTVIQRRGNLGSPIDFFDKSWNTYKEGFGSLDKEFWLGNDNIFILTHQNSYSAIFELESIDQQHVYALYDKFWIDDESHNYKLNIKGYSGNAGDSMGNHDGNFFSTGDRDNDRAKDYHCARDRSSGWWFYHCLSCNLNGIRFQGSYDSNFNNGIEWQGFLTSFKSLVSTEIKIRPINVCKSSKDTCSDAMTHKEFTIKTHSKTPHEQFSQEESYARPYSIGHLLKTLIFWAVVLYILYLLKLFGPFLILWILIRTNLLRYGLGESMGRLFR